MICPSSPNEKMKNGELFDGDTLNQVWPQQKTPPRLWWWDEQQ